MVCSWKMLKNGHRQHIPATLLCFSFKKTVIGLYLYMRIDACVFRQKYENRTSCGETTRARPKPPQEESKDTRKVMHVDRTPHRMVDLTSSWGVHGSQHGQNLAFWLLRWHGQHIYTYNNIPTSKWSPAGHVRNYRRFRHIKAVKASEYCQRMPSIRDRVIPKTNKTGARFNEPATNLAFWHTMTNSSGK